MDVQFKEEQFVQGRTKIPAARAGLIALLIRWEIASNEKEAVRVLAAVLCLLVIGIALLFFISRPAPKPPTPEEIRALQRQEGV